MATYKQVSPEQVDLWLADPVTKAYLECVNYCIDKVQTDAYSGGFIDPTNNDLTCHNFSCAHGRRLAMIECSNPTKLLADYEKAEVAQ